MPPFLCLSSSDGFLAPIGTSVLIFNRKFGEHDRFALFLSAMQRLMLHQHYRETYLTAQVLTEEQLRRYFSQFGEVLDVYLPKHNSGRNKGFGFTTFETEVQLLAALQVCGARAVCISTISEAKRVHKTTRCVQSSEHVIDGVVVRINRAGPRPEYDQSRREEVRQPYFS